MILYSCLKQFYLVIIYNKIMESTYGIMSMNFFEISNYEIHVLV